MKENKCYSSKFSLFFFFWFGFVLFFNCMTIRQYLSKDVICPCFKMEISLWMLGSSYVLRNLKLYTDVICPCLYFVELQFFLFFFSTITSIIILPKSQIIFLSKVTNVRNLGMLHHQIKYDNLN